MSHPVDVHVGSKLRAFRTQRQLSQTSLGKQVGLTFQQIQKYEKGTNRIGASRLHQFALALSVPVEAFFTGLEEGDPKRSYVPPAPLSRIDLAIVDLLGRIRDSHVKRQIKNLLSAVAEAVPSATAPQLSPSSSRR
jgi:transcriptional regulator with XRE-family HTH domain